MTGIFTKNNTLRNLAVLVLLLLGFGIRLLDLTDPPLDIHPTRQLHSALMARGMYYQTVTDAPEWQIKTAIQQGKREAVIEPPVLETLTASLYRLAGGEYVWIARILSSLFWVIAGLSVFLLAYALTTADGGTTALIFYLFLPYGVMASRTFQPDPLMVALICTAWWTFHRWLKTPDWKWTILAGLCSGMAIFVKNVSLFFLLVPFALMVINNNIRSTLKNPKVWLLAILAVMPFQAYTLYGTFVARFLGQQFSFRIFPNLWLDISNYSRWVSKINDTVGIPALALGLIGLYLFTGRPERKYVLGMWAGYLLYGFTFAYHIGTHDYYQLPLIPILALSLAPLGSLVGSQVSMLKMGKLGKPLLSFLVILPVLLLLWQNREILKSQDYRAEPAFWRSLGDRLRDFPVVGLTQDYGYRLAYYGWDSIANWPGSGDIEVRNLAGKNVKDFQELVAKEISGKSYFLVTWFEDYARQPDLKTYLENNYPKEIGTGYELFDLTKPLTP